MPTDAILPLTALQLFKTVLYEIHKVEAPSFDLEEFNHFVNRAQLEYANRRYTLFEAQQQQTDDLRMLIKLQEVDVVRGALVNELPEDYFHALRVLVRFQANNNFEAYRAGDSFERHAKRSTADLQGYTESPNYYARASYRQPYWRIERNVLRLLTGVHQKLDLVGYQLEYLRTPKLVTLYQSDLDDPTTDNSQLLDWPAYVCNELAKVLVTLFLENTQNARLNTYPIVGQSIPNQMASPAQAASQQPQQQQSDN